MNRSACQTRWTSLIIKRIFNLLLFPSNRSSLGFEQDLIWLSHIFFFLKKEKNLLQVIMAVNKYYKSVLNHRKFYLCARKCTIWSVNNSFESCKRGRWHQGICFKKREHPKPLTIRYALSFDTLWPNITSTDLPWDPDNFSTSLILSTQPWLSCHIYGSLTSRTIHTHIWYFQIWSFFIFIFLFWFFLSLLGVINLSIGEQFIIILM